MFSLIITIISIALVAALALATIYYGGSAFTRGGDAAKASQLINEGQQLQGALTLANADAVSIASEGELVSKNYLSQVPAGWTMEADAFQAADVTDAVCKEVNDKAGLGKVRVADMPEGKVYACIGDTGNGTVQYRF